MDKDINNRFDMIRIISVSFILIALITLLAGCNSNNDETVLIEWLQSISKDNTDIYIVDYNGMDDEKLAMILSADEIQTFIDISGKTSLENITPDEHPYELPSVRYLIMLNDKEKQYKKELLQLVSLEGDFKITYMEKDWMIKNEELGKYVLSFF